MKKITVSLLSAVLMLSMAFSSSVFAAEKTSAWDSFLGLFSNDTATTESTVGVQYKGHVQNIGDVDWVVGPEVLGTEGQSLRLEAFYIELTDAPADMHIQYRVQVQNKGWMDWAEDGAIAGTTGKGLQVETVEIKLVDDNGDAYPGYSVQYRGHIQNKGDMPADESWYVDGQQLGTVGEFLRLEALRVQIVKDAADLTAYNEAVATANGLTEADYTTASWAALQTALTDNVVTEDNTQDEVDAATAAINDAIDALVALTKVDTIETLDANSVLVTFTAAVDAVDTTNFATTDENDDMLFVSDADLSADGLTATVTYFDTFEDGMTYTVETSGITDTVGNAVEDTDMFTYEYALPATIEFTATTISSDEATLDDYLTITDELGRVVTDEVIDDVEYETSNAAVVDANGNIIGAGSAIVVAKLDADGEGTYITTGQVAIKVSDSEAASLAGFYLTDAAVATTADFKELDDEDVVQYVSLGNESLSLAVYYNDQYGTDDLAAVETFNGGAATLTNLSPTKIIVNDDGSVQPIAVGNGYVKVVNGDVTSTLKIVVRDEAVLTSMEFDPTSVALSTGATVNEQVVDITYYDQYGTEFTTADVNKLTVESNDVDVATVTKDDVNTLTVTAQADGTTTIDVTYDDNDDVLIEESISVTISDSGDLAGYLVENADDTLDVAAGDDYPANSLVEVFSVDSNGVKIEQLTAGAADGNFSLKAVDENGDADASVVTINGDLETVDAVAAGTGYVEVYVDSLLYETLTFTVVNTDSVASSVVFDALTIDAGELTGVEVDVDGLLYTDVDNGIMTFKDQYGDEFDASGLVTFTYYVTNQDGITIAPTTPNGAQITDADATGGTADIVITSITVDGGDNLLSAPKTVKIEAIDAVANDA